MGAGGGSRTGLDELAPLPLTQWSGTLPKFNRPLGSQVAGWASAWDRRSIHGKDS